MFQYPHREARQVTDRPRLFATRRNHETIKHDTYCFLINNTPMKEIKGVSLTNTEILLIAKSVNIAPAALKAVQLVETAGRSGFVAPGQPVILFEGHIFWKQLLVRHINPYQHQLNNADILYPRWDRSKYKGGLAEYARLRRAVAIDAEAAYKSASWGMFQIMGFNHRQCGVASIHEFVQQMSESEYRQLKLTVTFLKNTLLIVHLRQLNWEEFARGYNGPGYAANHYAQKLKVAYLVSQSYF